MLYLKILYLIIFKVLGIKVPYPVNMTTVEVSKINCKPNYKLVRKILKWRSFKLWNIIEVKNCIGLIQFHYGIGLECCYL